MKNQSVLSFLLINLVMKYFPKKVGILGIQFLNLVGMVGLYCYLGLGILVPMLEGKQILLVM